MGRALARGFYRRPTALVARELLGKELWLRTDGGVRRGWISETEAYLSEGDPASHSHRGPTPRAAIMFGRPGFAYVYFVYGMYHCLNAVTEAPGIGAAVLIRAVTGIDGPGRLCREWGIDLKMTGWDLTGSDLRILDAPAVPKSRVTVGPRVGLTKAAELHLRFRLTGN